MVHVPRPGHTTAPADSPPVIGADTESERIAQALAPRDRGNLPALSAQPLIRLDAYVAEDGSTVVNGHLLTMGGTRPPNEAILDAVAMFARTLGTPVAATVIDRSVRQVARLRVHPDGSSRTIAEEEDLPPGRERTTAEERTFPPLARVERIIQHAKREELHAAFVLARRAAGTPDPAPGRGGRTVAGGTGDRGVHRLSPRRLLDLHRTRVDRRTHPLRQRSAPGRARGGPRHRGVATAPGPDSGGDQRTGTAAHVGEVVRGGITAGTVPPRHGPGRPQPDGKGHSVPGDPGHRPCSRSPARGTGGRRPRGRTSRTHSERTAALHQADRAIGGLNPDHDA